MVRRDRQARTRQSGALLTLARSERPPGCACGSSGAAGCGAGGLETGARGRGARREGAEGVDVDYPLATVEDLRQALVEFKARYNREWLWERHGVLIRGYMSQLGSIRIAFRTWDTVNANPFFAPDPSVLRRTLQPGDVLLVEGNSRLAATIKFLTQSTWSHAALYVGDTHPGGGGESRSIFGAPNAIRPATMEPVLATLAACSSPKLVASRAAASLSPPTLS